MKFVLLARYISVSVTYIVENRSGSMWAHKRAKWEADKTDGKRESELLQDIAHRLGE